jgi:hypothetical protein
MNRPASTHQAIPRHSAMCHLLAWAIPAASWLAALSVTNADPSSFRCSDEL